MATRYTSLGLMDIPNCPLSSEDFENIFRCHFSNDALCHPDPSANLDSELLPVARHISRCIERDMASEPAGALLSGVMELTSAMAHEALCKRLKQRGFKSQSVDGEVQLYYTPADWTLMSASAEVEGASVLQFRAADGSSKQVLMSPQELKFVSKDMFNPRNGADLLANMLRGFETATTVVYTLPTASVAKDTFTFRWSEGRLE